MRRVFVLALAFVIAMPVVVYAGSVTSRWDVMIGGTVKADVGWTDSKGSTAMTAANYPARDSQPGYDTVNNKYGNQFWGAGESALNFTVRGPDTWGAKTRAFISGDFTGAWGGSGYGSFNLMLATMSFDWPKTTLTVGQAGSAFGMLNTFSYDIAWGSLGFGGKGAAPVAPQVTLTQMFGKNWTAKFGVLSPVNATSAVNTFPTGTTNDNFRATIPLFHGGLNYASDALGKVGPWRLTLGVGGAYGQEKKTFATNSGGTQYDDANLDVWFADFKFLVPIIGQKNDGNKSGALYVDGSVFTGQNLSGGYYGSFAGSGALAYVRSGSLGTTNYASPVGYGYYAHAAYFFTDQLWMNGFYWYAGINTSDSFKSRFPNTIKNTYNVTFNLMYDPSPAVRFALQYEYTKSNYSGPSTTVGLTDVGTRNVIRAAAYYYF